jgi:hypothetical protein
MIKLFRNLREKLLLEGNTTKYLKYAIGEIVLVVIGILIALQINNWNEEQKEKALEFDILREIRNGLTTDLADANFNLKSQIDKIRAQNIIIEWLESDHDFNDSLSSYVNIIHYGTYFQSNETPYQILKQLGLRTIKNDSLRNQLSKLYDLLYQQYDKYNEQYENLTDVLTSEAANYYTELDYFGNTMKPINIAGLRANNKYMFQLKTTKKFNEILTNETIPKIIDEISKTITMIDTELEKRHSSYHL